MYGLWHPPGGGGGLTLVSFPMVVVSFNEWSWSGRERESRGEEWGVRWGTYIDSKYSVVLFMQQARLGV